MPGFGPDIHRLVKKMDCRVKPGSRSGAKMSAFRMTDAPRGRPSAARVVAAGWRISRGQKTGRCDHPAIMF
jgi:hypothetical protein